MPIAYDVKRTPGGREYIHAQTSGFVDEAQANEFNERFRPGGPYAGKPLFNIIGSDTSYTVQSRRLFTAGEAAIPVAAFVVANPPLRVMLNFIIKAANLVGAQVSNARTFSQIGEAEAWLLGELDGREAR